MTKMKINVRESKKKEEVSRGPRDLLDDSELTQEIQSLYENELEKLIDGADEKEKPYYQSVDYLLEDYIPATVESIQNDMYKYVSGGDYKIPGNFKQINWDWDRDHKDGIKFNDLRKKLLDGVNDADTEEFSHWGIDWFFKAFGTFGLTYNFREAVSDVVYNDMAEDGVLDESKKSEATKFIDSKIDALVKEISDKYGFTLQEKTRPGWETSWYLASGNTLGHMADGKIAIWINGFRPNGEFLNLGYKVGKGAATSVGKDIRTFDTLKKNLLADCDKYFGAGASEAKKSEGISDMIDAKIDYNMFMRMCKTAAYLEEDEDYWDALWEYYSDLGSIGDALVFFDNLFQYTAWKDVEETYDELKDEYKDESKSKEECIEKAIDDGALDGVYPYGDHYLWIY